MKIEIVDVPTTDDIKSLPLTLEERAEIGSLLANDKRIFFPTPGPQFAAFTSSADIIGYGGAAGGGKTYLVSGLALTEHKRSVIFRQSKNQTRKFIQDFADMLGGSDGYSSQNSEWKLGSKLIEFGGFEDPKDFEKWQGRDHDLKAYDEATQMREHDVRYTMGWNRSPDPAQRCRTVLTFNPP
ncbi:MAG: terminase, partial [bacterium]|nr:terminase [bacterium]